MSIEEENLHVTLHNEDGELPPEVTVRKGEAKPVREPRILQETGTIEAPIDYYVHMRDKDHADFSKAVLLVDLDPEEPSIRLKENPHSYYGTVITGTMMESDEVKELGINRSGTYDNLQLANKLKMNRSLFTDMDVNIDLVHKLKEFTYKVEQERKNHDDDRGTKRVAMEQVANTDLPEDFELEVPIFKGEKRKKVTVELMYQFNGGGMDFWLESPELIDDKRKIGKDLVEGQIARLEDENKDDIPIIYVGMIA